MVVDIWGSCADLIEQHHSIGRNSSAFQFGVVIDIATSCDRRRGNVIGMTTRVSALLDSEDAIVDYCRSFVDMVDSGACVLVISVKLRLSVLDDYDIADVLGWDAGRQRSSE